MGGFSAQVQPSQSSAPAGKGAGMSSMQMGQNPIQKPWTQKFMNNMEPNDGAIDPTQNNPQFQPTYGGQSTGTGLQATGMAGGTGMLGGTVTMPGQGGQPQLGMPNAYSNTLSPWDNQVQQKGQGLGKGFGNGV